MGLKIFILGIWICCAVPGTLRSQGSDPVQRNYHLIYVELSDNNNRMGLVDELNKLYNTLSDSGDYFITYLSDARNGKFFVKSDRIEELFLLIQDLNTALPDVEYDLRRITEYWNQDDITYLDKKGITHILFDHLSIHYFVSPAFYELSGNHFASKLLTINNINALNQNISQVSQWFHFSSADIEMSILADMERNYKEGLDHQIRRRFITY